MYRIGKKFGFEAAHHLTGLPTGHKCARVHGHSYVAEFVVAAQGLVPPGFVTDFADFAPVKQYIAEALDHRDLNEVLAVQPTSEALAEHLFKWAIANFTDTIPGELELVRVSETATSYAEYRPDERS